MKRQSGAPLLLVPAIILAVALIAPKKGEQPAREPQQTPLERVADKPLREGKAAAPAEDSVSPLQGKLAAQQDAGRQTAESLRNFEASQDATTGAVEFEIGAEEEKPMIPVIPGSETQNLTALNTTSSPKPIGEPGMRLDDGSVTRFIPKNVNGVPAVGPAPAPEDCATCKRVPINPLLRVSVVPGLKTLGRPRQASIMVVNTSNRVVHNVRVRIEGESRDRVAGTLGVGQRMTLPATLSLARRAIPDPDLFRMHVYAEGRELGKQTQTFRMECDPPAQQNTLGQ